jgi:hypothetical protein
MSRVARTIRVPVGLSRAERGRSRRSILELGIAVARVDFKGGRLETLS